MRNKTAVVVGATGLIGQALVDQLAEADHIQKIVTLTRRPAAHPNPRVQNRVVDFERLDKSASLFRGDFLFSCLGTTRKQAGSLQAQRRIDLDYQFKAAKPAADNGVGHYLLVSSSGADPHSRNGYMRMKGELEQRVRGLPFTRISIFQPSLLTGQRGDLRMGEKLGSFILPVLCRLPGLHRYRPIQGKEVAAKMIRVSRAPGKTLEHFRLDEIFF